jgi:SpoVK/Ycf46/Vps4 family AAA+-type ATPase
VVDEADELLNTNDRYLSSNTLEKGQINAILDNTKNIIIWITNHYDNIDESTMRRFDYSIEFGKLTFLQRKFIWQTNLEKYDILNMLSQEDIEKFILNYEINAGCINIVLQNIARFKDSGMDKETMKGMIEKMIKANLQVTGGITFVDTKKPNAPFYSLEGINVKANMPSTIKMLERFNIIWSDPLEAMPMKNMNILLYGPPGTGKTEFAKYVARTLNRCLVIKPASDLLSCWVGETEKIIKNSFQEAEKDKAILFIDEADSMLGSREGATHSWEITQVNEILNNMETFHGMLICSTNFKKVVDNAAMRRFNIKLEFDYLTPEGALLFYNLFLAKLTDVPISKKIEENIKAMSGLTPGDFKVVYNKFLLFDKSEKGELTHEKLLDNLNQELIARDSKFGKTMGFEKKEY